MYRGVGGDRDGDVGCQSLPGLSPSILSNHISSLINREHTISRKLILNYIAVVGEWFHANNITMGRHKNNTE